MTQASSHLSKGISSTPSAPSAPTVLKLLAHDVRWRLISALAHSDLRVQDLATLLAEPQNLISYHLRQMREGGIVQEHRSAADGRDVYYALDLPYLQSLYVETAELLHPAILDAGLLGALRDETETQASEETTRLADGRFGQLVSGARGLPSVLPSALAHPHARVLFLCTHNSARSQMAEGIMRLVAPEVTVYSAGSAPTRVHPLAVSTLGAMGIDISQQRAKHVDEFRGESFTHIVTLCDIVREGCPAFPGSPTTMHWSFPDPSLVHERDGARERAFSQTALQLFTRLRYLLPVIQRQAPHVA